MFTPCFRLISVTISALLVDIVGLLFSLADIVDCKAYFESYRHWYIQNLDPAEANRLIEERSAIVIEWYEVIALAMVCHVMR